MEEIKIKASSFSIKNTKYVYLLKIDAKILNINEIKLKIKLKANYLVTPFL